MMPRKKRRTIIILVIIAILIIIGIIFSLLYIMTDSFKSSETLFTKYIGQGIENIKTFSQKMGQNSEYDELIAQNKYITSTQIRVSDTENIGTTAESSENIINQLKIQMNGQIDKGNDYHYQEVQLLNQDEKVSEFQYIQNGTMCGVRFPNLFQQYLLTENEGIKELLKRAGYTEEQLENIPDKIEWELDFKNLITLDIQTSYLAILKEDLVAENFSKHPNQTIQIGDKTIKANAYTLTVTKEQLNNIYIKILEQVKEDEHILSKMDEIETLLGSLKKEEEKTLRTQFIEEVEKQITKITKNNIGNEEAKITVYESNQVTVRTLIQNEGYEITMDLLSYGKSDYVQLSYQDATIGKEEEKTFIYQKEDGSTTIQIKNKQKEKIVQYSLAIEEALTDHNVTKNIVARYEDNDNRIEALIEQEMNRVENFEEITNLENAINLNELEDESLTLILEQVSTKLLEEINEITTSKIKMEDIWKVLKTLGIIEEEQNFQAIGITETEKNRFNSKFEILQGENLDSNAMLRLIDAIRENFIEIEVVSNTEVKLKLDRFKNNEEVANTLTSFIEENKNRKFNTKVEYDEETGLVINILLTILER